MQLYNASGDLVGEQVFQGTAADGERTLEVVANDPFAEVVFTAGAGAGADFTSGALVDPGSGDAVDAFSDGLGSHGSGYLLDFLEFRFGDSAERASSSDLSDPLGTDGT